MAESHVISALVSKHSELQGNIKYYQDIVLKLRSELETIDKAIAIFDPSYKTTFIQAKRISNASYFPHGESIMDDILSRCLADNSISNEFCGYWQGNHRVAERLGA